MQKEEGMGMGVEERRDKAPQVGMTAGLLDQVSSSKRSLPTPVLPTTSLKSVLRAGPVYFQGSDALGQSSAHSFLNHWAVMRTQGLRGATVWRS